MSTDSLGPAGSQDGAPRTDAGEDMAAFDSAVAGCPMLQEPRPSQIGGKNAGISPLHYMAETLQPREDIPELPLSWGLHREDIGAVHKGGIQVANEMFSCPEMAPYITGPKDRRSFEIRYDRALAASHRLNEILLYEKMPDGSCRFRLRIPRKSVLSSRFSRALIESERHKALKKLLAKRGEMEDAYQRRVAGSGAVERLIDSAITRQNRRTKLQKPEREDDVSDTPDTEEPSRLAEALAAQESEIAAEESRDEEETADDASMASADDGEWGARGGGDDDVSPLARALMKKESTDTPARSGEEK